jgi:hypothetical protein
MSNPRRSESAKTTLPEPQFFHYKLFPFTYEVIPGQPGFHSDIEISLELDFKENLFSYAKVSR